MLLPETQLKVTNKILSLYAQPYKVLEHRSMKLDVQLLEFVFPECFSYLFIFYVMRAEKYLPSAD